MTIHIENSKTRLDCERDNKAVRVPNSTLIGFSVRRCKAGYWLSYERDSYHYVGRAICRVICENEEYIEVAQMSLDGRFAYLQWIKPASVRACYAAVPRHVLEWLASAEWNPQAVHAALAYGVSSLRDDMSALETEAGRAAL